MNKKRMVEVLEMIAQDQEDDAKNFEGAPVVQAAPHANPKQADMFAELDTES
jgi:hypothetical protein